MLLRAPSKINYSDGPQETLFRIDLHQGLSQHTSFGSLLLFIVQCHFALIYRNFLEILKSQKEKQSYQGKGPNLRKCLTE